MTSVCLQLRHLLLLSGRRQLATLFSTSASSSGPSVDPPSSNIWELNEEDAKRISAMVDGRGRGRQASRSLGGRGDFAASQATAGGFRLLMVPGLTKEAAKPVLKKSRHFLFARESRMRPSRSSWLSVWPASRTFHPAVVPLPVRQGRPNNLTENAGISPMKFGNTELIKVPNFLHLTPDHVAAHCALLRPLCTPWPKALDSPAVVERHLPIRVVTTDYLRATASLRDPRAKRVEISLPLSCLKKLDARSREKLLCLVSFSNYAKVSRDSRRLTMWSDRCPWRFQNFDYLMYALSALYSQSLRVEPWESNKEWRDNRLYQFAGSSSELKLQQLPVPPPSRVVTEYVNSLQKLHHADERAGGETHENLRRYASSVKRLLGLTLDPPPPQARAPEQQFSSPLRSDLHAVVTEPPKSAPPTQ